MGRQYRPFDPFGERNPFERPIQDIHIPPPPRRFWVGLAFFGLAILVFFLVGPLVGFITEIQWFDALDLRSIYLTRWGLEAELFGGSLLVAFTFVALNVLVASRLRSGPSLRAVGIRGRGALRSLPTLGGLGGALLIALILSAGAGGQWQTLALFLHYSPAGVSDPVFGQDASFYMLTLPFYRALDNWLLGLVFMALLVIALIYTWRGETFELHLAPRPLAHVSILAALLALGLAASAYLGRYELLFAQNGFVHGPGFADVNARIPLGTARAALAVLIALALLANLVVQRPAVLVVAVGVWIAGALVGAIYPGTIQRLQVAPAEGTVEQPYILREIDFTRRAFGLGSVQPKNYAGTSNLTSDQVAADAPTIENLRLWDDRILLDVYSQLQSLRSYYDFNTINLDRYTIGGQYQQLEISAREMNQDRLPAGAQTWVNQELRYTHGYGVAASQVAAVSGEGLPAYVVKDIPPAGDLPVTVPSIYFGQTGRSYVLAPSAQAEFDYPSGTDNVNTSYTGTHGVRMDGANRALWSLRTSDFNLLISDQIQPRTQILYRRNVVERAQAIAPFLAYPDQPYIVVVDGKLYWLIDAYTSSASYPYSPHQGDGENYLRNSVKVLVDAYEGTVSFYVADDADPVLKAYRATFPGLFKPLASMRSGVQAHLRVPPYMFKTQAQVYAQYHVSNPQTFYNHEDIWDFATEQSAPNTPAGTLNPYYVLMRLPGEQNAEYLQILPFTPHGKANMIAWLAARNDAPHYGELAAFVLSKDVNIFGPQQISSRINATPQISRDLSLLNQNGSQVTFGNLLVVPVGNSFLYFEPLYLRASGANSIPELKKVILADKDSVAYADTLPQALDQLVGGRGVAPGPTPAPSPGAGPTPGPAPSGSQAQLADLALQHYNAAQDALKRGDFVTYASEIQQVGQILQQMSAGASPSPSPGPSVKPSASPTR